MSKLNMDEIHEAWMDEFERIAWSYCESAYGEKPCIGVICKIKDVASDCEDGPALEVVAKFKLPCGADRLIRDMAKFCRMSIGGLYSAELTDRQNDNFTRNSFCLRSLLHASYPRNMNTMRFKGHEGPSCVMDLNELPEEKKPYCAFCGIGIMLFTEARKCLSPLSTDASVLELSDESIFGIIDGGAS